MKRLIYFELRKIFSRRLAQIALIGVLLFTALLSITTYRNKYAYDPYIGQGSGKRRWKSTKQLRQGMRGY